MLARLVRPQKEVRTVDAPKSTSPKSRNAVENVVRFAGSLGLTRNPVFVHLGEFYHIGY
jgi:hypothetical protein